MQLDRQRDGRTDGQTEHNHSRAYQQLVNCCFEPSQPLGIISGLKKTFIKRNVVERANQADIRPEEQNEKTESCRENLWNEIQSKGP